MDEKKVAIEETSAAVVAEVSFFLAANPILDSILDAVNRAAESASKIAVLEQGIMQQTPAQQPVQDAVAANKNELRPDTTGAMKKRGIDIASIAFFLPMLINEESRKYLASFLTGLIGIENIEALNNGLKLVTLALGAYLGVKVFKQVADTFNTFVRLSQLMGILFNVVSDADDGLDEDKRKHEKDKEDYDKKKKQNRQRRKGKRVERLKRLKQVKNARKIIGTLKKALLIGGPIGIAVGIGSGILIDSLIDYATGDEEKAIEVEDKADINDDEPEVAAPEQTEASKFGDILIKNFVSTFNFKQIAKDTIASIGTLFTTKPEDVTPTEDLTDPEAAMFNGAVPTSKPVTPATSESKPSVTSSPATQVSVPASAAPEPSKPVTTGTSLQTTSEKVAAEKKDQTSSGNVVITNVNNQTIVAVQEDKKPEPKAITTSTSVGR